MRKNCVSQTECDDGRAGGAELSLSLAKAGVPAPRQRAAVEQAGSRLKKARATAGMSTRELGRAIDLEDPVLLEQAERGAADRGQPASCAAGPAARFRRS